MSEPILRIPLSEAEAHRKRLTALEALVAKLEAENAELRAATPAKAKGKAKKNSSAPTTPLAPWPDWAPDGGRRRFLEEMEGRGCLGLIEARNLAEMREGKRCAVCGHGADDTEAIVDATRPTMRVPLPHAHTPGCPGEVQP